MSKHKISWTDETWNPVIGCSKVSEGCQNCYAERMAWRLACMGQSDYRKVIKRTGHYNHQKNQSEDMKPYWTGKILHRESELEKPLHWKKPRKIFVCSMSDLFAAPFEFIDKVFAVMALTPQHTYQLLTKRADGMLEYFEAEPHGQIDVQIIKGLEYFVGKRKKYAGQGRLDYLRKRGDRDWLWPLPNVHLGVTCENQEWADERIPKLLQIPAAKRFVSLEPLLGPIDLENIDLKRKWPFKAETEKLNALLGYGRSSRSSNPEGAMFCDREYNKLDQVIIGCESLPGGRAGRFQDGFIEVAIDIVRQCRAAGVKCHVKQIPIGGRVCHDIGFFPKELESNYVKS